MKDLLKIKLFLLCVIALCLLSYKMGQNSNEPKETNEINFVWEGLEKDIPADGDRLINLSTNENTIYLNPAD